MALNTGDKLGPYEIVALTGKGGMGEVYRATDLVLKRDVALKVLPARLAGDRERMQRFLREAEVLASLNHPNIAQIYGIEESAGTRAIVMELVEGETLADTIKPDAVRAIKILKRLRLRLIVLSGDREEAARVVAQQTQIQHGR